MTCGRRRLRFLGDPKAGCPGRGLKRMKTALGRGWSIALIRSLERSSCTRLMTGIRHERTEQRARFDFVSQR
jgi:hypothetical protein